MAWTTPKTDFANGDVLTAAEMNAVGNDLAYLYALPTPSFVAGKNKILNGDFGINQRIFTTTTTNATYGFDRWWIRTAGTGGTTTYSAQTFTPGTAPVSGYEGTNFARVLTSGFTGTNTLVALRNQIEDVRVLAGQTFTISLWAKAASGTPTIGFNFTQNFGAGGSTAVTNAAVSTPLTISTSWQRYTFSATLPSLAGKTIGTGSYLQIGVDFAIGSDFYTDNPNLGVQNNTFDIWGVQLEAGSVATPFTTATGNPALELAACQRYCCKIADNAVDFSVPATRSSLTGTNVWVNLAVPMRTTPSISSSTGLFGRIVMWDTSFSLVVENVTAMSVALVATTNQIPLVTTHASRAGTYVNAEWDTFLNGGNIILSAEL